MEIYSCILKLIKQLLNKIVMAFSANQLIVNNKQIKQEPASVNIGQNQLNPQEIATLIGIIKATTFSGEHIENLYNTVIKLQNQYIEQTSK